MFKKISTDKAPKPVGSYSQALQFQNLLFLSGQIALDPKTNQMVTAEPRLQTIQVFNNIIAVLEAAKTTLNNVIKCTIFLTDIEDFAVVDKTYQEFFKDHTPARSTVQVTNLPKGSLVEIEVIAVVDPS